MKSLLNHHLPRRNADGMRGLLKNFKLGTHFPKHHMVTKKMFGSQVGRGHFRSPSIGRKFTSKHTSGDHGIEPSMAELEKMLTHHSSGAYGSSIRKKKKLFNFKSGF